MGGGSAIGTVRCPFSNRPNKVRGSEVKMGTFLRPPALLLALAATAILLSSSSMSVHGCFGGSKAKGKSRSVTFPKEEEEEESHQSGGEIRAPFVSQIAPIRAHAL